MLFEFVLDSGTQDERREMHECMSTRMFTLARHYAATGCDVDVYLGCRDHGTLCHRVQRAALRVRNV
jgi:hypothetical protein